jgi:hypothetical protein
VDENELSDFEKRWKSFKRMEMIYLGKLSRTAVALEGVVGKSLYGRECT